MSDIRIPLHSIQPSEGRVTCTIVQNGEPHQGFIEQSFFEDATGGRSLNKTQQRDLVINSLPYLQAQAKKQLQKGEQEVHIV